MHDAQRGLNRHPGNGSLRSVRVDVDGKATGRQGGNVTVRAGMIFVHD